MNYLPRNRTRNPYYRLVAYLVLVFVVGALIFYFLGGVILSVITPAWKAENIFTRQLSSLTEFFHFESTLIAENENLKARVNALEATLANRSALSSEESAVLSRLGREPQLTGIAAAVLVRPPKTPYDRLVIDAGSNDRIAVGQEVSLPEGPVLGSVAEVFRNSAQVKLFSTPGEKTSAILERTHSVVELEGVGGGGFKVSVPREEVVVVGDRILSADISARLVGVVEAVNVTPTDSFKEVLARGPASLFNISLVVVR